MESIKNRVMIQFDYEDEEVLGNKDNSLRTLPKEIDFNQEIDGIIEGHDYVDLGLSNGLLIATTNLGAETPWGLGENAESIVIDKEEDERVYWDKDKGPDVEKIDTTNRKGVRMVSDLTTLQWGKDWKTPTLSELKILLEECRWIPSIVKKTPGFIVQGPNKKEIFLPTRQPWFRTPSMTNIPCEDFHVRYASSTYDSQNFLGLYFIYKDSEYELTVNNNRETQRRCFAFFPNIFIRPVLRYSNDSVQIFKNDNLDLQPIDLGLSRKWSPINLGSKNEKDAGWYFHWAGTTKIDESNHWKINKDIQHEEKEIIGGDKDKDAVTSILGEGWRTPSKQDFEELVDKCTWEKEFEDYIFTGYRVTGPNGNSIFLPRTDYISPENRHLNIKTYYGGSYWSSESCEEDATMNNAWYLRFNNHGKDIYWNHIWKTKAIRPVHD